jgi:hypothetical protein
MPTQEGLGQNWPNEPVRKGVMRKGINITALYYNICNICLLIYSPGRLRFIFTGGYEPSRTLKKGYLMLDLQIEQVLAGSATCDARAHLNLRLRRVHAEPQCGLRLTFSSQEPK